MSKKVYALVQKMSKMTQEYYPEQLGILLIVNAPWSFTAVWSAVKGWLDERTRAKIVIVGGRPIDELRKHIDEDQIPDFLGGRNTAPLEKDIGPWNDFEVVDGSRRGDIVGIRRISDGPNGRIFTMDDLQALPNDILKDPQNSVEYWKLNRRQDQQGSATIERGMPKKLILSSYSDFDTHDSPIRIQQGYSSASQQDLKSAGDSKYRRVQRIDDFSSSVEEAKQFEIASPELSPKPPATYRSAEQVQQIAEQPPPVPPKRPQSCVDIVTYADPPRMPSLKKKRRRQKRKSRSIEKRIIDAQYERFSVKRKLQRVTDRARYMERVRALKQAEDKVSNHEAMSQAFLAAILGLLVGACIQILFTTTTIE